jgi:uncharacterized protein DUF3455
VARQPWLVSSFALVNLACRQSVPDRSASADACPATWLKAPVVEGPIAVPAGNERMVLHASAAGSQNYACSAAAGAGAASYVWSPVGPEATLVDCHATPIGHHFAVDGGAPEWQMLDGAYVVAHKQAASIRDARSVPWLLLSVDRRGGSDPLSEARYVQRLGTSGGVAPGSLCDARNAGAVEKIPYTADYFFYAP